MTATAWNWGVSAVLNRHEIRARLAARQLDRIKAEIRQNLFDPLMSPERAARLVNMSVRKLHMLFAKSGMSFSKFVLRERLAYARQALTDPKRAEEQSISNLAFSIGFNSLATFYRAYGAAFGEAPGVTRLRTLADG